MHFIASLLVYLLGILFTSNLYVLNHPSPPPYPNNHLFHQTTNSPHSVLIFIITILLLAADFYYLKNIAGRRLVGLRWWNEVDAQSGDSHWVFESSDPAVKVINATDSRFFWIALYSQPLLWVALAVVAIFKLEFIWLTLVGEFLIFYIIIFYPVFSWGKRGWFSLVGMCWEWEGVYSALMK